MSQVSFQCHSCGTNLAARSQLAGLTISCPVCETHVRVPDGEQAEQAQQNASSQTNESTNSSSNSDRKPTAERVFSRVRSTVDEGVSELRELDYRALIPRGNILNPNNLRNRSVQWALILGLAPLFLFQATRIFGLGFNSILWMIQSYFCALWGVYFFRQAKLPRGTWKRALGYASFTAVIGIPLLLFAIQLPGIRQIYMQTASPDFLSRASGYIFGVGLFEELTKALPLLLLGLKRDQIKGPRDGLFLGLASGLGFAAAEGVAYVSMAANFAGPDVTLLQFLFRAMSGPLLHGAMAGVVGWFIGVAATRVNRPKWPLVAVGIGLMGLLHGLYDVFAGGFIGIGIFSLIVVTFLTYLNHSPNVGGDSGTEQLQDLAIEVRD